MAKEPVYRVVFYNQGQVYEVFAKQIFQSDLWGFIEVEEFTFSESTKVIVSPAEEKLKNEFSGVKRSYIPMHSLIRIDEMDREGQVKVTDVAKSDNITHFPFAGMPTNRPTSGKE